MRLSQAPELLRLALSPLISLTLSSLSDHHSTHSHTSRHLQPGFWLHCFYTAGFTLLFFDAFLGRNTKMIDVFNMSCIKSIFCNTSL